MSAFTKYCLLSLFLLVSPCLVADVPSVEYVVANAAVCPVREKPSHAAEQTTQLLFGELCEVVEQRSGWVQIRSTMDGQVGWVTSSMLTPISSPIANSQSSIAVVVTPYATATPADGGAPLLLTLGTRLSHYSHGVFEVLGERYLIDSTCVSQPISYSSHSERHMGGTPSDCHRVCAIAHTLLNTPYLWGGKTAMGLDCSGFTQVVYAAVGISLLRNAREQITQGKLVSSLSDAQSGDLAFFDHSDRNPEATKITHVGMLLSPTEIIHCAGGRVHIDRIDANGIHLSDGTMTHHLVAIKRYL
jgi:cell wall-associated NlpC family hydrolase